MLATVSVKTAAETFVNQIAYWLPASSKTSGLIDARKIKVVDYITKGLRISQYFEFKELKEARYIVPISSKDGWLFVSQNVENKNFLLLYEKKGIPSMKTFGCQFLLDNLVYSVKFGVFFGVENDRMHLFSDIISEMAKIVSHDLPEMSTCLVFDDDLRRLFSGAMGRVLTWKFEPKWNAAETTLPTPMSLFIPDEGRTDDLVPKMIKTDDKYNQLMVATDSCLYIFSLATWKVTHTIPQTYISSATFHDLTQVLLTANDNGEVQMIDTSLMATSLVPFYESKPHSTSVINLEILGSGPYIAVSGDIDGSVLSWDLSLREEGIYGLELAERVDKISGSKSSPMPLMCGLDDESFYCHVHSNLLTCRFEAFGWPFASFQSNVQSVDSNVFVTESLKRNWIGVYTSEGIWFSIDAATGSPKGSVALPGEDRASKRNRRVAFRNTMSTTPKGVHDTALNLFWVISTAGNIVEYDTTDNPGKVTCGGLFKPLPILGRIHCVVAVNVPLSRLCDEEPELIDKTTYRTTTADELLILAGHSTGKISLLVARTAYHFQQESFSSIESLGLEGYDVIAMASASDYSCCMMVAAGNCRGSVTIWTLQRVNTTETLAPHLTTISCRKSFDFEIGKAKFEISKPPILFLAFNRLWVFLKDRSSQEPPVICRLKDGRDGVVEAEGTSSDDDASISAVNVITSSRVFVTVDNASTFRVWQVTDFEDTATGNQENPPIFLTREVHVEGLVSGIDGFGMMCGFCYYASGNTIMVVEPSELFRPEQIEAMSAYYPKSVKRNLKSFNIDDDDDNAEKAKTVNLVSEATYNQARSMINKMADDPYPFIDRLVQRIRRALHTSLVVILYEINVNRGYLNVYTNNVPYNSDEPQSSSEDKTVNELSAAAKFARMLKLKMDCIFLSTIWDRTSAAERSNLYVLGREIFSAHSLPQAQDPASQPFDPNVVFPAGKMDLYTKVFHLDELLKTLAMQYSLSPPAEDGPDKIPESEKKLLKIMSTSRYTVAPDMHLPNSVIRSNYDNAKIDQAAQKKIKNPLSFEDKLAVIEKQQRSKLKFSNKKAIWRIQSLLWNDEINENELKEIMEELNQNSEENNSVRNENEEDDAFDEDGGFILPEDTFQHDDFGPISRSSRKTSLASLRSGILIASLRSSNASLANSKQPAPQVEQKKTDFLTLPVPNKTALTKSISLGPQYMLEQVHRKNSTASDFSLGYGLSFLGKRLDSSSPAVTTAATLPTPDVKSSPVTIAFGTALKETNSVLSSKLSVGTQSSKAASIKHVTKISINTPPRLFVTKEKTAALETSKPNPGSSLLTIVPDRPASSLGPSASHRFLISSSKGRLSPESPLMYQYYDNAANKQTSTSLPSPFRQRANTEPSSSLSKLATKVKADSPRNSPSTEEKNAAKSDRLLKMAMLLSKTSFDSSALKDDFDEENPYNFDKFWPPRNSLYVGNPYLAYCRSIPQNKRPSKGSSLGSTACSINKDEPFGNKSWVNFVASAETPRDESKKSPIQPHTGVRYVWNK